MAATVIASVSGSRAIRFLLVLVVIAAVAAPRAAEACTCGMVESPGEALTRAETAFVGTVGEVKKIEAGRYETTFAVSEVFRGQPGKTIVVASRWNGGTCDAGPFKTGDRMLIFGGGRGPLYVSHCSGSKLVASAAADLAYLRRSKAAGIATVEGTVTYRDRSSGEEVRKPRVNVEVRARGTKVAARTGADGAFRLELPPGKHTLEVVETDPRFTTSAGALSGAIELPAVGTLARRDFDVTWSGRIRGRLLDHTGQPAANVLVRTFDADRGDPGGYGGIWYGPNAQTDAGGNYEIAGLLEGRYLVAVSMPFNTEFPIPTTYYPGAPAHQGARAVEISRANPLAANTDFKLPPPRRLFTITGVVARARKTPSYPNARVTLLSKTDNRKSETIAAGDDAKFEFKEVAGSEVMIYACDGPLGEGDCGDLISFKLDSDRTIRIVLPH